MLSVKSLMAGYQEIAYLDEFFYGCFLWMCLWMYFIRVILGVCWQIQVTNVVEQTYNNITYKHMLQAT